MKRSFATFLIVLSLLATKTVCSQPQKSSSELISIPKDDLRNLVLNRDQLAEQRNLLVQRVNKLQEDNVVLNQIIAANKMQIGALQVSDSISRKMYKSFMDDTAIWVQIRENNEKQISNLQIALRKEKRRKKWTAFGGIAGMAALTYLYITK